MLSRRTMPLSALGICVLYAVAISQYGIFHLADYPVFLGVAAYLALTGWQVDLRGVRPIDVLRWTAGITLMWASIEKWAYPEWSYPLFIEHPGMSLGFTPEFYMRAAGAVEFALAFSLIWTPLVRRVGAIILAGMFVSAVFEFGKIDLIGHTLIVVALFGIIADNGGQASRLRDSWLLPFGYVASLAAFLAIYYVGHEALSAPRSSRAPERLDLQACWTCKLLDVDHELHLRMDGAQYIEVAGNREYDIGLAARLLVAGVERELRRIDIGVVQEIAVVVDDLDGLAAFDLHLAGMKLAPLLRDRVLRQCQTDERA